MDSLVDDGEFSSRAEVYRAGSLIMVLQKNARDLLHKSQLDPTIFGKHLKNCLDSIANNNPDSTLDELRFIISGLIFRELTSILLNEYDEKVSFENFRTGLQNYEKTLMKFEQLKDNEKDIFFPQLKNDLSILKTYVAEQIHDDVHENWASSPADILKSYIDNKLDWPTWSATRSEPAEIAAAGTGASLVYPYQRKKLDAGNLMLYSYMFSKVLAQSGA